VNKSEELSAVSSPRSPKSKDIKSRNHLDLDLGKFVPLRTTGPR